MIFKTRGIVFRFTKFRETSIIVSIFTEAFGLQRYIVNGVRTKSPKNKIALYQPLTLLDMVVYHRENANIERIKEARCYYPFQTLGTDVRKSTIAMFINELLNKVVKQESHDEALFLFLSDSLQAIDKLADRFENAHLTFMIHLSRHLGFGPQFANEILGGRVADEETERILAELLRANPGQMITISHIQRRIILDLLIKFYGDHIENLGEFRSVQVLRDVLN